MTSITEDVFFKEKQREEERKRKGTSFCQNTSYYSRQLWKFM